MATGLTDPIAATKDLQNVQPEAPMWARVAVQRLDVMLAGANAIEAKDLDPSTYDALVQQGIDVATLVKKLQNERLEITKPLDELKQRWMEIYRGPVELGNRVLEVLRGKAGAYVAHQREKQRQAELAAQRERERAERERREAIAEERRRADAQREAEEKDARERADAARKEAEAELSSAIASGDQAKALQASDRIDIVERDATEAVESIQAEHAFAHDEIVAASEAARIPAVVPSAHVHVPKSTRAASARVTWDWELPDSQLKTFLRGILAAVDKGDDSMLELIQPSNAKIGIRVRALGSYANIPGVRVWEKTSVAFGGRQS